MEGSFPYFLFLEKSAGFSSPSLLWIGRAFPRSWPSLGAQKLQNNERTSADMQGLEHMGVSKNSGTPKWMGNNGKPYSNG